MRRTLFFAACILVLGATAWATMPYHVGDANPNDEGWPLSRTFITGDALVGAVDGPAWMTKAQVTNDQCYYGGLFDAADLPADWQMTVTVKALLATSHEGCFFALGDGSVIWEFDILTSEGASGLYGKIRSAPYWNLIKAFPADNEFHTYRIVRYAANDFASVYMDNELAGTVLAADQYPYTSRRELQVGGGAWNDPAEAHWSLIQVSEAPPSIEGTITLEDFTGNLALCPVEIQITGQQERTVTTTLDATGYYKILGLAPGMYNLAFSANKWLTRVLVDVEVTPDAAAVCDVSLPNGDINGDGGIGFGDFNILRKNWGLENE